MNITIDNSNAPLVITHRTNKNEAILPVESPRAKNKFKKITSELFCRIYRIEDNVGTTTRAEGPKYISNYADGIGRVLRVVPFGLKSAMMAGGKD
jgi:hypothetical protein